MRKEYPDYRPDGRTHSPISIPISRRITTLAALIHCSSIVLLPCLYFYLWTKESFWWVLILYTLYSYVLDNTQSTGESIYRTCDWLKRNFIFRGFVDYFPIITHRTVPLPPTFAYKSVTEECFPTWTRALPSIVRRAFIFFHLISKKLRNITKDEVVGPRYIFACHPHGVISFGITGSMCWGGEAEVTDTIIEDKDQSRGTLTHNLSSSKSFASLFPGIKAHLLTLSAQLLLPFYRDYIMALGVGLVTKSSILSILKRNHSVTIVVGGAHESLLARPGMNRIVLNKRKGFIKIALESCDKAEAHDNAEAAAIEANIEGGKWDKSMSNIAVVPVYVFGENNIHNVYNTTEENTFAEKNKTGLLKTFLKLQLILKKYTGFTIPLVNSRSIFNYDFGLLPYKRRLDVVFGEPIYVYRKFGAKVGDKVTEKEIDYYHELYKEKLIELWRRNKEFSAEWDEDLQIVK